MGCFSFSSLPFNSYGQDGGGGKRWRHLSTLSSRVLGMHASGLRGQVRGTFFSSALPSVQFIQTGRKGIKGCRRLLISEAALLVCMRGVGSGSASDVMFRTFLPSTHGGGAFSMYANESRGQAEATCFLPAVGHSNFLEPGSGIGGFGCSLPSAPAFLACKPADRIASVQGMLFFCALTLQLSRTGWVGGK